MLLNSSYLEILAEGAKVHEKMSTQPEILRDRLFCLVFTNDL